MLALDLYSCRLGSLTDLGHCAYELRHCPQCAGAFAVCAVCPSLGALCPGCRHRAVLAQIAAGEVVFPEIHRINGNPHPEGTAQAGELAHVAQAVTVDAGSPVVYAACVDHPPSHVSPGLGATPVDTITSPLVLLVLPVDLAGVPPVLQALAAVIAPQAMNGHTNGPLPAAPDSQRRLPRKTYLSDTACPSGHTYQDTGKALRFLGNNQCVPCSGQRRPRRTAASTPAATEG